MGMRITTNMMMNTYRYNLAGTTVNLSDARDKVLTQRKFSSYAEDPATATHAWRVRRSLTRNAGYQTSNTEAYSRLNSAWATMKSIDDKLLNGDGGAFSAIKRADNYPTGGGRTALGNVLSNLAESIVFSLNGAQYGDHFLFAGNDEMNAPFSWDGGKLLYRGVNVDAGGLASPLTEPDWGALDENGVPVNMPDTPANEYEAAWKQYYEDLAAPANAQKALESAQVSLEAAQAAFDAADAAYTKLHEVHLAAKAASEADPTNADLKAAAEAAEAECLAAKDTLDGAQGLLTAAETAVADAEARIPEAEEAAQNAQNPAESAVPDWLKKDGEAPEAKDLPEWMQDITIPKPGDDNYPADDDLIGKAWLAYASDQQDLAKLNAMSAEVKNMDVGMGLQEQTGDRDLIQSTAFNRAIPGINMIGYGVDEDGDPKSIVSIMKRLAELYSDCDNETGEFGYHNSAGEFVKSEEIEEEVYRLLNKFNQAHSEFNKAYSEVDTRSEFLLANGERLKDQGYTLKEQIADLEQVDMADAINDFSWSYYCYSAALKIGNQLLSQSLIDYMS